MWKKEEGNCPFSFAFRPGQFLRDTYHPHGSYQLSIPILCDFFFFLKNFFITETFKTCTRQNSITNSHVPSHLVYHYQLVADLVSSIYPFRSPLPYEFEVNSTSFINFQNAEGSYHWIRNSPPFLSILSDGDNWKLPGGVIYGVSSLQAALKAHILSCYPCIPFQELYSTCRQEKWWPTCIIQPASPLLVHGRSMKDPNAFHQL